MIEINGIAHIVLSVPKFEESKIFYRDLLSFLGLHKINDTDQLLYYVGGRTAVGIQPCSSQFEETIFEQGRVGLHHVCFRAKSEDAINDLYEHLKSKDVKIVTPPKYGKWAPGYYYLLFEDPNGIRLEINFVPGKGLLDKGSNFNPGKDYD